MRKGNTIFKYGFIPRPMTTVNIYLTFNGNCEEAFVFYKSVFGGDFRYLGRYGEMPLQNDIPYVADAKDKIMHVTLPISKETMLMGNDALHVNDSSAFQGNNFTISIQTDTKAKADRLFAGLSEGGQRTMEMKETFWGSYYGMLTDKFGIHWKLNVDLSGENRQ